VETPTALVNTKADLIELATDSDLPHVIIREHAKRALASLAREDVITLSPSEEAALQNVNAIKKGYAPREKGQPSGRYAAREESRCVFKFDEMDTIPYWYDRATQLFPGVSHVQFLRMAERWIMQKWGAQAEANYWDREPRKGRYDERRFGRYSHSHGSLPVMERYGTYLGVAQAKKTTKFQSNDEKAIIAGLGIWSDAFSPKPKMRVKVVYGDEEPDENQGEKSIEQVTQDVIAEARLALDKFENELSAPKPTSEGRKASTKTKKRGK
jgi:hypothetical protein